MIIRAFLLLIFGCSVLYSQAIRAADNLVLPVNPPRSASKAPQVDIRQQVEIAYVTNGPWGFEEGTTSGYSPASRDCPQDAELKTEMTELRKEISELRTTK